MENGTILNYIANEEYIEEIKALLQSLENYKLRWLHKLIKGILEVKNEL